MSLSNKVTQTPAAQLLSLTSSVEFKCSHRITDYDMILWYQQSKGENALKLIGYIYYSDNRTEDSFKERFGITARGANEAILRINNVKTEDNAVGIGMLKALGFTVFLMRVTDDSSSGLCTALSVIMVKVLITLVLLCMTGLSLCKEVTQTPPALFVRSGDSLQFSCSHKINSYDTILWYQQSEIGGALILIGYVYYTANTTEDSYKDHFSVTGNGESEVLLHITKVKSEDTAVSGLCTALSIIMVKVPITLVLFCMT
ncbi:hypothetical protein Z043_125194, partial [Scleropages formosus]